MISLIKEGGSVITDIQTVLKKLKDGYYLVDIIEVDSDVRAMRSYYRGVVLPAISESQGNTDWVQHEELLEMHAPKIQMGDREDLMRTREMQKAHWIYFLNQVITYWSNEVYIPEANTMDKINKKYVESIQDNSNTDC